MPSPTATPLAPADLAIAWFDKHARDLPWRRPGTTAWGVLVSEIMLQQTPAARVEPAWEVWMARWPTPVSLAVDPPAEVIRAWGRLGYPRRALRLHAAATAIVARHGGEVPADVEALLALPGIGRYTARAVAAFGFGQRHAVVDTNVRRFVARLRDGRPDAGETTGPADLAATEALLPAEPARAARASVAFMELGAVVCTARAPRCHECPMRMVCAWRAGGAALPGGRTRRPQTYAGTHRQIRGNLLEVLRGAEGPVSRARLAQAWPEPDRREAALASLVEDGLAVQTAPEEFALGPGGHAART
jgi:A/G-specific adenine glycosylase